MAPSQTQDPSETMHGTFTGVAVRPGRGGGLTSAPPGSEGPATHFHAARLSGLGDTVLAVTRVFDRVTGAPLTLELRAFSAGAPSRSTLLQLTADEFVEAEGAVAIASIDMAAPGDEADERRPAVLTQLAVVGALAPAVAREVAEWLRLTWERELAFGSWPAVCGDVAGVSAAGETSGWAEDWLTHSEHRVDDDGRFLKVLAATWLEPLTAST